MRGPIRWYLLVMSYLCFISNLNIIFSYTMTISDFRHFTLYTLRIMILVISYLGVDIFQHVPFILNTNLHSDNNNQMEKKWKEFSANRRTQGQVTPHSFGCIWQVSLISSNYRWVELMRASNPQCFNFWSSPKGDSNRIIDWSSIWVN